MLEEHGITHVLSVIRYTLDNVNGFQDDKLVHLSIDIDDVEEADILVHLPKLVRFIEHGLYGEPTKERSSLPLAGPPDDDSITEAPPTPSGPVVSSDADASRRSKGAVLVHCAMGKSRSVTAVIAYLLWKYPHRFGSVEAHAPNRFSAAHNAVLRALHWVRQTRGIAEPNDGFIKQLELWWEMGCPADSDDAVSKHRTYRRWAYRREVEEAAQLGLAPDRLMFEDEEGDAADREGRSTASMSPEDGSAGSLGAVTGAGVELRCKKCRRMLATKQFVVPHQTRSLPEASCPHFFIEPLSWMRPVLEMGALEGRLVCPNTKCGASIGRYAWQGFRCSCSEWVCPAFSLQKSKVDEVATSPPRGPSGMAVVGVEANRMAALGIRLPPRSRRAAEGAPGKENL